MKLMSPAHADNRFLALVKSPLKFRLYLLAKLPAAFFSGVRVRTISMESAMVTVPYTWFSQNPFRSTYFACLAMAAEMSTGLLAMLHTYQCQPPVSMLVTGLEATYYKKATGITSFVCADGNAVAHAIQEALRTGEARTLRMYSEGKNAAGEKIAEFYITWSFKVKTTGSSV